MSYGFQESTDRHMISRTGTQWRLGRKCQGQTRMPPGLSLPRSPACFSLHLPLLLSHGSISPQDGNHGDQPPRVLLPTPAAISQSQLGSSPGKIERPGLDPVPTPDQSAEARSVVGSKNMVPSRLMGGPQWRWCKKHGPIVRRPGTGSLEPLPIWGHVH